MNQILMNHPRVLRRQLLIGQNVCSHRPVLTADVEFSALYEMSDGKSAVEFADRFHEIFPCSENALNGSPTVHAFFRRLHDDPQSVAGPAWLLAAILSLEMRVLRRMGYVDNIDRIGVNVRPDSSFVLMWETFNPPLSRNALKVALQGVAEITDTKLPGARPLMDEIDRLFARASSQRIDSMTAVLKSAASKNAIPFQLTDGNFLLGEGCHQIPVVPTKTALNGAGKRHEYANRNRPTAGREYSLFMIGNRCVAAISRHQPVVTGDGRTPLSALISALNTEADRDGIRLFPVIEDDALHRHLEAQNLSIDAVPESGKRITLCDDSNLISGATTQDVTDIVHPDYSVLAAKAVLACGEDIASVDIVTSDISRPCPNAASVSVEVNNCPTPTVHHWPRKGEPRDVARVMLDHIIPFPREHIIPSLVFAGDCATSSAATQASAMLNQTGLRVGTALKRGVSIDGVAQSPPDGRINRAPAMLLHNSTVEALVTALSLRRVVNSGLGFSRCDGVALQLQTKEQEAVTVNGIDVLIHACSGPFTIDAGHPLADMLIDKIGPDRVILVSEVPDDSNVAAHIAKGGYAATRQWGAQGPRIQLARRDGVLASAPLESRTHTRERLIYAGMHAFALVQGAGLARKL